MALDGGIQACGIVFTSQEPLRHKAHSMQEAFTFGHPVHRD